MFSKIVGGVRKKISSWSTRAKLATAVATALLALGQTATIDTTSMISMINAFLPLIMAMIAFMVPLVFLGKIMDMIEKLFKSFS